MKAVDRAGRIASAQALAALASPVRQEIIDTVESLGGSATIAEIAGQLGRPADGLYYHVRRLVRVGLLTGSGAPEVYRTPARRLALDYAVDARAVRRVIGGLLRIARKDFDAALATTTAIRGPRRALWASRTKGWVGPAELAEINRLLGRIEKLLLRPRRPTDRLASWSFVLAPVTPRPVRRERRKR